MDALVQAWASNLEASLSGKSARRLLKIDVYACAWQEAKMELQ
jgi:hypothetical protein